MARPVRDPGFRAAVFERDGYETGAGVVESHAQPLGAALEKRRPFDTRGFKVRSEAIGRVIEAPGEDSWILVALGLSKREPCAEGPRRVGPQGPRARIVGLVLIERDGAALQVQIGPLE